MTVSELRLIDSADLQNELQRHAYIANRRALIVSAFIKAPALSWLLSCLEVPDVTVICRWRPDDLLSGASDLEVFDLISNYGGEFRVNNNLHAKAYALDENIIVGSPNLTSKGLGLDDNLNHELSISYKVREQDELVLQKYLRDSTLVNRDIYDDMVTWLQDKPKITPPSVKLTWPASVLPSCKDPTQYIFTFIDFPCLNPEAYISLNGSAQQLNDTTVALGSVEQIRDFDEALTLFKKSSAYKWVCSIMGRGQEMRFGELTAKLHDQFSRDPRPYRPDIKQTVRCLCTWLNSLPEFTVAIPSARSVVVTRLV